MHHTRRALCLLALLIVPCSAAPPEGSGLPSRAWWPEWRHDGHRSGHSQLPGDITRPGLRWRYFLGGPLVELVHVAADAAEVSDAHHLDGSGGAYRVQTTTKAVAVHDARTGTEVWRRELKEHAGGYRAMVADFDPARTGLELAVWPLQGNYTGDFGDRALCFGFSDGIDRPQLLWTVEPPVGHLYSPSFMQADVDADGVTEIVIVAMDRVTVWDGATGHLDYNVAWNVHRNYGNAACVNIDDDPYLEIVVVADYVPHVDVLDVTDGEGGARLLWRHEYRPGMENNPKLADMFLRARPNSVSDLDGDGVPEVVVNLYSRERDRRWHVVVYDVRDGRTLADAPDRFCWGIEDLDSDGTMELLCVETRTVDPRRLGRLTLYRFAGSRLKDLWTTASARLLLKVRPMPESAALGAKDGHSTVLLVDVDRDGVQEFLIERDTDGDRLADRFEAYALRPDGQVQQSEWHYDAPPGRVVNARGYADADGDEEPELQLSEPVTGDVVSVDSQGREISRAAGAAATGFSTVPVAADVDGDGHCEIAVVSSYGQVELLRAPQAGAGEAVRALWAKKGHGMAWYPGYSRPTSMLALADLEGDGAVETIYCGETADGQATIAAAEPDGRVQWEHVLEGVGTDGIYSGVSHWFVGDFVGDGTKDVGVVYHKIGNGSNEMEMLDGTNGTTAWRVDQFVSDGIPAFVATRPVHAVHDFDGDGKDDIAYIDVYSSVILRGRDGGLLAGKGVVNVYGTTLNYPYTMLADLDGDGATDILHHGPLMHTMAQTAGMEKLWFVDFGMQANHFPPAIADLDGDGRVEIAMPGEDGVFRCLRGNDGTLLWQEEIGHPGAGSVGSADVDGDGVVDCFFVSKAGELVVVRGKVEPGQSRLLWSIPVGIGLHPIFADVDGDSKGEFLISTGDGYLKCVDQADTDSR